jgi:hypothetical protein
MGEPFVGSEALAAGHLTPYALRSRFVAIHRDVSVSPDTRITAEVRGKAAWLWSGRNAVVAGCSASALHGAKWVDDDAPPRFSTAIGVRRAGFTRGRIVTSPMKSGLFVGWW